MRRAEDKSAHVLAAAAVLGVVCFRATPASAAPDETTSLPGVQLEWDAPRGCPEAVDVVRSVEAIVGRRSVTERRDTVHVRGVVRREDGAFRVALETQRDGARGRRSVTAADCGQATEAAVVMIAMLVDAPSNDDVPGATTSPPPASLEGPAERDATESDATTAGSARGRSGLRVGVGGFVDSATLPSAAPGALATMAWEGARLRVHAGIGGSLPMRGEGRTTLDGRTLGVDAGLWLCTLRGEIHTASRSIVLGAQAGTDAGVIHASGVGAWVPKTTSTFWIAMAAGPTARVTISERLALRASVEVLVPLVRPTLAIDTEVLHRPAALSARGTVTAELQL